MSINQQNSKQRENLNLKTDETTLQVNRKRGSPSFGLTILHLGTFLVSLSQNTPKKKQIGANLQTVFLFFPRFPKETIKCLPVTIIECFVQAIKF